MRVWLWGGLFALLFSASSYAQDAGWGNLDDLILNNLPQAGEVQSAFWLPDNADPTIAHTALAFVYAHIPGSAGSVSLQIGLFSRDSVGWAFRTRVEGVYGFSPRDVLFVGDQIEVTTTTLGPDEPRCCPTQTTRFRIDRTTGAVTELP